MPIRKRRPTKTRDGESMLELDRTTETFAAVT